MPHSSITQEPTDPLASPGLLRILLSEAASRHLTETGEQVFALVARASWPDNPKRWVIHLLPLDMQTARAAESVALGKARAVRIKPPAPRKP